MPPSKRAMVGQPQTGDSAESAEALSSSAGMTSEIDRVEVSQPNPIADQGVAPCPPTLMNHQGSIPSSDFWHINVGFDAAAGHAENNWGIYTIGADDIQN